MAEGRKTEHVPPFINTSYAPQSTDSCNLDKPTTINLLHLTYEQKRKLLNQLWKRESANSSKTPWTREHAALAKILERQLTYRVRDALVSSKQSNKR